MCIHHISYVITSSKTSLCVSCPCSDHKHMFSQWMSSWAWSEVGTLCPWCFHVEGPPIRVTLPISHPPSITPLQGWRMTLQRLWEMEMGFFFCIYLLADRMHCALLLWAASCLGTGPLGDVWGCPAGNGKWLENLTNPLTWQFTDSQKRCLTPVFISQLVQNLRWGKRSGIYWSL